MILVSSRPMPGRSRGTAKRSTARCAAASATCPRARALRQDEGTRGSRFFGRLHGMVEPEITQRTTAWIEPRDRLVRRPCAELQGQSAEGAVACAAVHQPEFLILDEPFSGLDPVNADMLLAVFNDLKAQGTTSSLFCRIRCSSSEALCERFCIITAGENRASRHARGPLAPPGRRVRESPAATPSAPCWMRYGRDLRHHRSRLGRLFGAVEHRLPERPESLVGAPTSITSMRSSRRSTTSTSRPSARRHERFHRRLLDRTDASHQVATVPDRPCCRHRQHRALHETAGPSAQRRIAITNVVLAAPPVLDRAKTLWRTPHHRRDHRGRDRAQRRLAEIPRRGRVDRHHRREGPQGHRLREGSVVQNLGTVGRLAPLNVALATDVSQARLAT